MDENDINHEEWKKYGFQNKNPRTDFRGAGLMGLKNLINYVETNNLIFLEMIKDENEFIFNENSSFYLVGIQCMSVSISVRKRMQQQQRKAKIKFV